MKTERTLLMEGQIRRGFLGKLYAGDDRRGADIFAPITEWHRPPAQFEHGVEHLVADIPKVEGSDGHPCRIYETRMPARFFKLEVLDSENSVGQPMKGFCLSTGSGDDVGRLIVQIALAVRDGMIGLERK